MLKEFNYKVEPTGTNSPLQNGGVEHFNQTLGMMTRDLLYGASLPAEYWSSALIHSVYLLSRLVHSRTKRTPYEALSGLKPDLSHLQMFGSRVCIQQTGTQRAKLDKHDFTSIFLGYTATNQNVVYIDVNSSRVKSTHHAFFNKVWYMHESRPPAAQLLFDCGVVTLEDLTTPSTHADPPPAPYPSINSTRVTQMTDLQCAIQTPLPLHISATPPLRMHLGGNGGLPTTDPHAGTFLASYSADGDAGRDYHIAARDLAQFYISCHAYKDGFPSASAGPGGTLQPHRFREA
jgi:hypothetical protein